MKTTTMAFLLTSVLAIGVAAALSGECDMANVVKGFYCEECDAVLEKKDLKSDVVTFTCPACEDVQEKAGKCEYCDKALVKKTSGKDVCPDCLAKPVEAEICVKTHYACPDCDEPGKKGGKCADCDVAFVEVVSRALIEYVCPECGDTSLKPGKCTDSECDACGKPLKRTCTMSGDAPHSK